MGKADRPLGGKAYGSIGHMPDSRLGSGDHFISYQQASFITGVCPRGYRVWAQEKLDGCCMVVAKVNGRIIALGRAGYQAETASYEHMRLFAPWVARRAARFDELLGEGDRVCGEWLPMAHSVRYEIRDQESLWHVFDVFRGDVRLDVPTVRMLALGAGLRVIPAIGWERSQRPPRPLVSLRVSLGSLRTEMGVLPMDEPEGVVYRVERKKGAAWETSFLAKWVRADFEPGRYLVGQPGNASTEPVWNTVGAQMTSD